MGIHRGTVAIGHVGYKSRCLSEKSLINRGEGSTEVVWDQIQAKARRGGGAGKGRRPKSEREKCKFWRVNIGHFVLFAYKFKSLDRNNKFSRHDWILL